MVKKVEEVSKLSGVSKRTLQYYDDEGILPARRSEENYRLYDEPAMERLWEILWYKEMGFKLNEIKLMLAVPEADIGAQLEEKCSLIGAKMQDLENQRELILHVKQCGMIPLPGKRDAEEQTYKQQIKKIKEERGMREWKWEDRKE